MPPPFQMKRHEGKPRRSPESRFYDTLKSQPVEIVLLRDGSVLTGTLLWVDRYSLGMQTNGTEKLINKGAIETIERSSEQRKRQHEWRGDAP